MKQKLVFWLKLLGFGLIALVVGLYTTYFVAAIWYWTEPVPSQPELPAGIELDYLEISFTSEDNVQLTGWYIPPQNDTIIILLHGYASNRSSILDHAHYLAQAGYGILLYDMRGHGESGGRYRSGGWADVTDVAAAVTFLKSEVGNHDEHIAVFGFSVGGQVALRAAAEIDEIEAVIADGPGIINNQDAPEATNAYEVALHVGEIIVNKGTEWRTGVQEPASVTEIVGSIAPKPILFIATGEEQGSENRIVSGYYQAANEPKTIWLIPEAYHGAGLAARPNEYPEQILQFLNGVFPP